MLNGPDTIETIRKWPTIPPPALAENPAVVSHGEFLDALLAEAHSRQWRTGTVKGAVSRAGADLAAGFTVPAFVQGPWTPALGVVRSTTWRTPLRFYAGAVCDVVGGHEPAVVYHCWQPDRANRDDLKALAEDALDGWTVQAKRLPRVLKELRQRKLDKGEAGRLLFEAGRARLPFGRTGAEKVMPGSRVFQVDNQFRDTGGKDALDLLVCFGAVARQNSPVDQLDQMVTFYAMTVARQTAGA